GSGVTALLASRAKAGGARRDRTDDLMLAKHALSQLSYGPVTRRRMLARYDVLAFAQGLRRSSLRRRGLAGPKRRARRLVGLGRLELPTSRLSSARSNQLSYKPLTRGAFACAHSGDERRMLSHSAAPRQRVRPRRKRNVDGEIPPVGLNDPEIVGP